MLDETVWRLNCLRESRAKCLYRALTTVGLPLLLDGLTVGDREGSPYCLTNQARTQARVPNTFGDAKKGTKDSEAITAPRTRRYTSPFDKLMDHAASIHVQ